MTSVQIDTINAFLYMEADIPNTIIWANDTYPVIASINNAERQLENGGFVAVKQLNLTLRLLNADGSPVLTTLPLPQQKLAYDGEMFRIEMVKKAPQGTHIRIRAVSDIRGI